MYKRQPLIIGDYDDLMRRSGGKLRLDSDEFHYIVGSDDPSGWEEDGDPWNQLFEDDYEEVPEGMEKVYFIEGTFFSENLRFEDLIARLSGWRDLDLDELDSEEQYATFEWTRPYPKGYWNPLRLLPDARQIIGHIVVEEDTLTVSAKTKSRMLAVLERLAEIFDTGLIRGPLTILDPFEEFQPEGSVQLANFP